MIVGISVALGSSEVDGNVGSGGRVGIGAEVEVRKKVDEDLAFFPRGINASVPKLLPVGIAVSGDRRRVTELEDAVGSAEW